MLDGIASFSLVASDHSANFVTDTDCPLVLSSTYLPTYLPTYQLIYRVTDVLQTIPDPLSPTQRLALGADVKTSHMTSNQHPIRTHCFSIELLLYIGSWFSIALMLSALFSGGPIRPHDLHLSSDDKVHLPQVRGLR